MQHAPPKELNEESVARWLWHVATTTYADSLNSGVPWEHAGTCGQGQSRAVASAVRALVVDAIRDAVGQVATTFIAAGILDVSPPALARMTDAIVSRVLGDVP